jgi:hypothetical protein
VSVLLALIVLLIVVATAPVLARTARAVSAWWSGRSEGSW